MYNFIVIFNWCYISTPYLFMYIIVISSKSLKVLLTFAKHWQTLHIYVSVYYLLIYLVMISRLHLVCTLNNDLMLNNHFLLITSNKKWLIKKCIPSKFILFFVVVFIIMSSCHHVMSSTLSLSVDNHINNSMSVTSTIISLITKLLLMCQHFVIFYSIVKKKWYVIPFLLNNDLDISPCLAEHDLNDDNCTANYCNRWRFDEEARLV